jgi:hypothetical protein
MVDTLPEAHISGRQMYFGVCVGIFICQEDSQ